jgi:hypothetical protein
MYFRSSNLFFLHDLEQRRYEIEICVNPYLNSVKNQNPNKE